MNDTDEQLAPYLSFETNNGLTAYTKLHKILAKKKRYHVPPLIAISSAQI
jgi:hypothetical protein